MTLEDAKRWLRARFEDGATCPCCNQHVKLYKRSLTSSMAYVLVLIERHFRSHPAQQWLHVPDYIRGMDLPPKISAGGDFAKLRYLGLIEEQPAVREDGSKRAGFYRITDRGRRFVRGEIRVPKYYYLYNQRLVHPESADETTLSLREAVENRFSYDELMRATPDGAVASGAF